MTMRNLTFAAALALTACAAPGGSVTSTTLSASDAATSLAVGQHLTMSTTTRPAPADTGQDPLVLMRLRHPDGREMVFEEANHAPMHVMAQSPGGPLAQIMGLFGEERPTLFITRSEDNNGAAFICGPSGPAALGLHRAADGSVHIAGLNQQIQFEQRPDGQTEAVPYSPDQVCARLRFRQ